MKIAERWRKKFSNRESEYRKSRYIKEKEIKRKRKRKREIAKEREREKKTERTRESGERKTHISSFHV